MPIEIGADEVQRLVREGGATLVEVLPKREYEEEHLPGSVNIPLKELREEAVAAFARDLPIVVYCWDDL